MKPAKALRLLSDPRHWPPLLRGIAAAVEHEHLKASCGEVNTVVDIGANRGQFSLIARACFPAARIVAFEPLVAPAAKFSAVFARDRDVALHRFAIGDQSHEGLMHLSGRDDSSSLLPILGLQDSIFPGTGEVGTLKVAVEPLDRVLSADQIKAPALLKLDVQGYELSALKGCERLLAAFRFVYLELSFVELYQGQALADDLIAYLQGRGFRLRGAYNLAHDREGRAVQGDFLFAREPERA